MMFARAMRFGSLLTPIALDLTMIFVANAFASVGILPSFQAINCRLNCSLASGSSITADPNCWNCPNDGMLDPLDLIFLFPNKLFTLLYRLNQTPGLPVTATVFAQQFIASVMSQTEITSTPAASNHHTR